jgi:hypothetical protein
LLRRQVDLAGSWLSSDAMIAGCAKRRAASWPAERQGRRLPDRHRPGGPAVRSPCVDVLAAGGTTCHGRAAAARQPGLGRPVPPGRGRPGVRRGRPAQRHLRSRGGGQSRRAADQPRACADQ